MRHSLFLFFTSLVTVLPLTALAQPTAPAPDQPTAGPAAAHTATVPAAPAPSEPVAPPIASEPVAAQPSEPEAAEAPAPAPAIETAASPKPVATPPAPAHKAEAFKGFLVQSEDGAYQLKIGGYVQADGRFFTQAKGSPINTFAVRRARLELKATVAHYFEFRLQPDFAESKVVLLDAYGNIHLIDEVQLQAGKMKSPVGLEYLQSPTDLLFPEFGLPSLLVPQRDVGFYVHGDIQKGTFTYQLGLFNGVADGTNGDLDENRAKDFEYRIFVQPFKPLKVKELEGFGIGLAGTVGKQKGVLPSFKTPGRETFFSYAATATADGNRVRFSPQGYYYYGPVGVLGEYVLSKQPVADGPTSGKIKTQAWQVAGSVVIGGKASYKGAEVDAPLDPKAGTWGALELGVRYGGLSVEKWAFDVGLADDTKAARSANSFGVEASWWFVKGTRAQVSFDQTSFKGGAAAGTNREKEGVVVTRLQVAL